MRTLKGWSKPFREPLKLEMAKQVGVRLELVQELRKCLTCNMWVPNDDQVIIDHAEKHYLK